ncbi:Pentatricopeptide repeat-containing protein [Thalictrum thalictroides]|uniref:Pentatricopeptide repeat-containing protein n=1 Tax=Thalictrum thalictroides TaxID=46969 RepID=A0A7J6XBI2_THATH|nr:Pentatricopeptide repeat-containing protein [Thalictrum thalictroides]
MVYAQRVFDRILNPNVLLWNAMFKGYSENGFYRETLVMFNQMRSKDVRPNFFTIPVVLKCCVKVSALRKGKEVHCIVIKSGFNENHFIGTNLVDVYSIEGEIESARKVFDEMPMRNVVAWTTIISGYISSGDVESARGLFDRSTDRDVIMWNIMISGYIGKGDMVTARKLFDEMGTRDVMSWNTILTGYVNNDDLEESERFFEEIPQKNVFSWNGLIAGYANKGRFFDVLRAFNKMLAESSVRPNDVTLVYVLSACSRLGALSLGKWVHVYAQSNGLKENTFVGNGLIDMYSKCGSIEIAVDIFNGMVSKDLITWNTMIGGLATHGRGTDALDVFHQMRNAAEKPDGITFVGVLCACSHMGLIEEGLSYFNLMTEGYSIIPQIEHYGCVVDLLARAGLLDEALDFIKKMPIEADSVIWSTLLGACKTYRKVQPAELALEWLIKLEPEDPANYLLLSNIYADARRWGDLARVKVAMRGTGIRKPPGCSLIEVNDNLIDFFSLDERHSDTEDIYKVLNGLSKLVKPLWLEPDLEEFVEENG